ncbi:aspartate aminotransferase family protein, partial [Campylobacter jejuni]
MKMDYKEQSHIVPAYKRFDIVLEKGQGVYLFDDKAKKYLDFSSGIGVCALGYNHAKFNAKIKAQVDKLLHTSNLYYNENIAAAAKNLAKASALERVFFTNSGTESIEGAMKTARKYAFNKGIKGGQFIAFKHSFHGRTLGALSLTANEKYQKPFKPLISGVKFAKYNDISSVEKLVNEKTCA